MNRSEPSGRPFVLVHGMFHGGWCWTFVAERLRALGHRVTTPTQTGLGERAHLMSGDITLGTFVTDVESHVVAEDLTDVVLVGHSFGGAAVTGVVDRIPDRIAHVVYLDALVPESGRSVFDTMDPAIVAGRRAKAVDHGSGPVWEPFDVTAFGIPADHPRAGWVRRRLTPHPVATYETAIELANPVGNGLPATYVCTTEPLYTPLAPSRAWVREHRPQWRWVELATGHDSMILEPELVATTLHAVAS
ncbi:alpha/beta fold hydrolase [Pseudonocardia nematodicida]|uniref:Alpha/beta fold hydrolase n=1 Tax=Pseudonocardia nematodicida TaxID=1206997 RepID=A0ABV1KBJ6_9PSEU